MRHTILFISFLALGFFTTFRPALAVDDEELLRAAQEIFRPLPRDPVFKKDNPFNEAKLKLGRMLYFDRRLSKSGVFSCNSCHDLAAGGVDNAPLSTGHQWKTGGRNAPTVFNAALHIAQFWDGRAADVEEQAVMPVANPVEMAASPELAEERLKSIPEYARLFKKAFPESAAPVTLANAGRAIAVFERTLLTPSRFDRFLEGDPAALSDDEKRGLEAFITIGCAICHSGIGVGGGVYQKFGVLRSPKPIEDRGRFDVTGDKSDMGVFKVPSLRNVAITYPYFHDGSEWSLKRAVWTMAWVQLGVRLTTVEMEYIITFLNALAGDRPPVEIPSLPPSTASTPRPDRD